MTYIDTSVALAWLLTEDRQHPVSLRDGMLVSSRLLEYETWTPLYAHGLAASHGEAASRLVGRAALLELAPGVLARALDAFPGPAPMRTLGAPQLASCSYLVDQGQDVELASCDRRMNDIPRAMDIPLFDPV